MNASPIGRPLAAPLTTVRQASPQDFFLNNQQQPINEKVGKKKKKKGTQELAPLGGVLPPTTGNSLFKPAIPSIQKKAEWKGFTLSFYFH